MPLAARKSPAPRATAHVTEATAAHMNAIAADIDDAHARTEATYARADDAHTRLDALPTGPSSTPLIAPRPTAGHPVRVVVWGDSRAEGFTPDPTTGGASSWGAAFPGRVADILRQRLDAPAGGGQWRPLSYTGEQPNYRYKLTETRDATSGAPVDASSTEEETGVPGSHWIDGGKITRIHLTPGTTDVEFVSHGSSYGVSLVGESGSNGTFGPDAGIGVSVLHDPGAWVEVNSVGGGFLGLGIIEYRGDLGAGVQSMNLGVSGATAQTLASRIGQPLRDLLAWFRPDVTVVAFGPNEVEQNVTAAATTTALNALLAASPSASATVSVTPVPLVDTVGAAGWAQQIGAHRGLAVDAVADLAARYADSDALPDGMTVDGVHLTDGGAMLYAEAIADAIVPRRA